MTHTGSLPARLVPPLVLAIAVLAADPLAAVAALPRTRPEGAAAPAAPTRRGKAAAPPAPRLAVAVLVRQRSVEVGGTAGCRVVDAAGRRLALRWGGSRSRVEGSLAGLKLDGGAATHARLSVLPAAGGLVIAGGRRYRGTLELRVDTGGLVTVINHVDVERYLHGVVKAEMSGSAPPAALRAQAIAARTFALRHGTVDPARGFGLTATEQSQVYGGAGMEDPRTIRAVDDTRGVVIAYDGELIEALYHAACGGATENNEDVWASAPAPYERSTRCDGCLSEPQPIWTASFDYAAIRRRLMDFRWDLGDIHRIDFTHTRTGRVRDVMVHHAAGLARVPGNMFRIMVDRRAIRSLLLAGPPEPATAAAVTATGTAAGNTAGALAAAGALSGARRAAAAADPDGGRKPPAGPPEAGPIRPSGRISTAAAEGRSSRRAERAGPPGPFPEAGPKGPLAASGRPPEGSDDPPPPDPADGPSAGADELAIQSIIGSYMSTARQGDGVLRLSGRGRGHGVGLCQWGAQVLARAGRTHEEILRTYYSGIELRRAYR
jgi:stage II sporulation protein D